MAHPRRPSSVLSGALAAALLSGCYMVVPLAKEDASARADGAVAPDGPAPASDGGAQPATDVVAPQDVPPSEGTGLGSVDLLVVMDNSSSMRAGQDWVNQNLGGVVTTLLETHGVRDVRVGVVSSDLGVRGAAIPQCGAAEGDDGILNPRLRGPAVSARDLAPQPAPVFCGMIDQLPYVTLQRADDPMFRLWAPSCHAAVGATGCGIEQQLEAARRALVERAAPGGPNAGFLRRDATLAILVVSDEDDGSARDCRYDDGYGACVDAADAFDATSTRWASPELNLRFYTYTPGSSQDPTWPVDRYVDPARPARGFLGLKPGHPERVVFAAITGVPTDTPRRADGSTDWDALLGPPAPGRPDDFNARDASRAYRNAMDPAGPTSMRQSDPDPQCAVRLLPACRAPGSVASTACAGPEAQRFAWRARRIAEVARRMDESALCGGAPCRNGMVASICDAHDSSPFTRLAAMIARRVTR